jgi:hypothetical protein
MPIIRRQRHSPNVLRFLQIDSAVSRSLRVDVHNVGYSAFVCGQDMNPDLHSHAQRDGSQNQSTVEIDDECLAFAHQTFAHTESLNPNLQTNPATPAGFTGNCFGGHLSPPMRRRMTDMWAQGNCQNCLLALGLLRSQSDLTSDSWPSIFRVAYLYCHS